MVMDEAGRNGGNWHLAQQIVQPVIRYVLSSTTNHITCNQTTYHAIINNKPHRLMHILFITIALSHRYGGDFYFSYKYQKFSPRIQL